MERTVEIPQLQLAQQNDEIPGSRRSVPREHTCPPGLKHLVEKVEMNTAMLMTMETVGIQAHGALQQR